MVDYADILLAGDEPQQQPFDVNKLAPEQRAAYERMMNGRAKQVPQAPPQPAPQMQAPAARPQVDYADELLGGTAPAMAQPQPQQREEGWGEWIKNGIMGKQDPREAQTGTVYEQFTDELTSPTATAAMYGADDEAMGNIIAQNLGDRVIRREKDANGYEVLVTRGPDGQEQRGYVNAPGLDTQDAWRTFYGAVPYALTGGVAGKALKGAGLGINTLAQGATAGATSFAGDVGALMQGSGKAPDLGKALVVGGFGAAGPAVGAAGGALWRRFVTIPGLIDKTTGKLTAKGMEYAQKAGFEPEDMTPEFAKSFAESLAKYDDPATAATQATMSRYGITPTRGQLSKQNSQLWKEDAVREGVYGEPAELAMKGFDEKQREAVRYAAFGGSPTSRNATSPKQGIGQQIAPNRTDGMTPTNTPPAALGTDIQSSVRGAREAAKAQEAELWKGTKDLKATPQALATLKDKINSALVDETDILPPSLQMDELLSKFIEGQVPQTSGKVLQVGKTESVDAMRRRLGDIVGDTPPGSSQYRQASKIYNAFNDWIGESAEKSLLAGDPQAALNIVKARGFHRDVMALFKPTNADGSPAAAAGRLKSVMNADSGEAVIDAVLASRGSKSAVNGSVGALQNIKTALEKYTPEQAAQAWGDIGLAYWTRLVTGKNGEMLGSTAIVNNIKSAMNEQGSIVRTLYTPAQVAEMRKFLFAMQQIAYKPRNPSGTSYGVGNLAREALNKVTSALMANKLTGMVANAALDKLGIGSAYGKTIAAKAIQSLPPKRPNLGPASAGVGQAYNQSGER